MRKLGLGLQRRVDVISAATDFSTDGIASTSWTDLSGPGDDLLSRVLRQSTIGAEAFDGRVRDGIGSYRLAEGHQAGEDQCGNAEDGKRMTENSVRRR